MSTSELRDATIATVSHVLSGIRHGMKPPRPRRHASVRHRGGGGGSGPHEMERDGRARHGDHGGSDAALSEQSSLLMGRSSGRGRARGGPTSADASVAPGQSFWQPGLAPNARQVG